MRLNVLLVAFPLIALTVHADPPSVTGTLPEDYLPALKPILEGAVSRAPGTIQASIEIVQAEATRIQDSSSLWPTLNGNVNYSADREAVTESSVPSSSSSAKGLYYGAYASQPIYQWGAYKAQADIGKLGEKVAHQDFAEAYRLLTVTLREQYLALIGKQVTLRNAQYRLKLANEALSTAEDKQKAGAISDAELTNSRLSQGDAEVYEQRAQIEFTYTKRTFMRLAGLDELADESIPVEVAHPNFDASQADALLSYFKAVGIQSLPQSQAYALDIQEQNLTYNIAKVRLLPKVALSGGYSVSNSSNAQTGFIYQEAVREASVSLGANWSVFDGFATSGAKMAALASKRYYERLQKTYIDSTIETATYLHAQLALYSRAASLAEGRHDLLKVGVDKLLDDQKLGFASPATVEIGVSSLYSADLEMVGARNDFLGRWTEFVSIAGADPVLLNLPSRNVR